MVPLYVVAQVAGAIAGVVAAHVMFELPLLQSPAHARGGMAQLASELIATFGLLIVVHSSGKRVTVVPLTVAAYITAAYWFTSSASFANPAVTIARGFTDTFSGIRRADVPGFIVAQLAGAVAATLVFRYALAPPRDGSDRSGDTLE